MRVLFELSFETTLADLGSFQWKHKIVLIHESGRILPRIYSLIDKILKFTWLDSVIQYQEKYMKNKIILKKINVMSFILIVFLSTNVIFTKDKQNKETGIQVYVDPRVELMSIIFRLAGNGEYNQRGVFLYVTDIEKHFGPFREHSVVEMAKNLRKIAGVGYDAPMSLAIYLTDPPELAERIDFEKYPELLDRRWTTETARNFLKEARQFVKDSDFMKFLHDHQDFYSVILERAQNFVKKEVHPEWFTSFFGSGAEGKFIIALAPNNGGPSYGPCYRSPDGIIEYYSVLGLGYPLLDEAGLPVFENIGFLTTIIHEFCHSFVNPLVDRHQQALSSLGEKLFPLAESFMRNQAYARWQAMMMETFVRTCVARYLLAFKGEEEAEAEVARQMARQFVLVEKLYSLLGEFESQRGSYATFDSFLPVMISALENMSKNPEEFAKIKNRLDTIAAERKEAARKRFEELKAHPERLPKVVETIPADGDVAVDPGLKEIRIEFDRSMNQNTLFIPIENTKFPEFTGEFRWESNSKIFILGVKFEPDTEYGYGLNSELAQNFADEKDTPLLPVVIRFKTGGRRAE